MTDPSLNPDAPRAHIRPVKKTRARFSRKATAAETIEGFTRDTDLVALTYGQFSLLDLIDATLDVTGPAHVLIATWSAGFYDIDAALAWRDSGRMLSTRFIMDSSDKRGQATPATVADLFDPHNIRTTRSHAKFVLLSNDDGWRVIITSSMNLNLNKRLEQFEITDDPERFNLFNTFAEAVWEQTPPGSTGDRKMPNIDTLPFEVEDTPATFAAADLSGWA